MSQADVAWDIAERWLYTRLHVLGTLVLGVLSFVLITGPTVATHTDLVCAAVAMLLGLFLPERMVSVAKHGGSMCHGLVSLQRMRQLPYFILSEELQSPVLRVRLPSARERRDIEKSALSKARGRIVLGDSVIERSTNQAQAAALYDLRLLEQGQTESVPGFAMEQVADDWPYFGGIEVENVELRYTPGATFVLQEASLRVPPSRALLLVGPAGAGKSTLLKALLRFHPTDTGRIVVDCVDTRSIGLQTLRSRIAFVPEETLVFEGTWRYNLDPLGEFEEEQLEFAVRISRLQNWLLQYAPRGLDEAVPSGAALDPAVRVLLGLCRALLRLLQKRSKLLVLDRTTCKLDATADADLTALLLCFCRRSEAAMLQVSRRLTQAYLYDQVAVMRGGRVLEQGHPRKLWAKGGAFRSLAREQELDSSTMAKPEMIADRLTSVWAWEVSPQEEAEWNDEFSVGMKKTRGSS